jgi:hypothetical protein
VNRVPTISALALLLSGCSLAANRDVKAYNACLSRHAQDVVVCEGPRQAYEADLSAHRATAAVTQPGPVHGTPEPALQSSAQGLFQVHSRNECIGPIVMGDVTGLFYLRTPLTRLAIVRR